MLTSDGANMFKFQVASVFNELFHRSKTINYEKMQQADQLYQKFSMSSKESRGRNKKQQSLPEEKVKEIMVEEFGSLEVERLFRIYKEKLDDKKELTFDDFKQMMQQLLEID